MNLKTKSTILALGALAVAGFTIWPGCASPPLPSKHHPISNLQAHDFVFDKTTHPTREEIFTTLGNPDEYFPDLGIACYKLERLTRRRIVLLFFILPVGYHKDFPDSLQVAFLQFDDHNRLKRCELKAVPEIYTQNHYFFYYSQKNHPNYWREVALKWSLEPVAKQKMH